MIGSAADWFRLQQPLEMCCSLRDTLDHNVARLSRKPGDQESVAFPP